MAYHIMGYQTNPITGETIFSILCDTAADLPTSPVSDNGYGGEIGQGSKAVIIADGTSYIADSSRNWIYQPNPNAWVNVYTKSEIDNMITEVYQTIIYYHTTQTSIDGAITFYALEGVVKSLSIYGNGSQSGTPTPDNPVMPEFVGVRTWNLADTEKGGLSNSDGSEVAYIATQSQIRSQYIPCDALAEYTVSITNYPCNNYVAFYAADKSFISRTSGTQISKPRIISTPENAAFMRVTMYHALDKQIYPFDAGAKIMLNSGSTALPYEPFGWAEKITCAGQTVPVYLGQTQTVRRIKKLVLTGQENWIYRSGEPKNVYFIELTGLSVVSNYGLCTHYLNQDSGSFSDLADKHVLCCLSPDGTKSYISIRDSSFQTLSSLISYLSDEYTAGTPVTVWYVLAEPTTGIVNEPLCKIGEYADELHSTDGEVTIPTINGSNVLTVDTDLPPSLIEISGGN